MPDVQQNPSFDKFLSTMGVKADPEAASMLETRRKKAEEAIAPVENASFQLPPKPQNRDPLDTFGSSAGWIAAFGSLLTKHPLTTALTASAAAMDATKKSDQDAYKKSVEQWKENNQIIMDRAKFELEAYKNAKSDSELHLLAQAYGNPSLTTFARLGQGKEYVKDYDAHLKNFEKSMSGAVGGLSEKMEINSYVKDKLAEAKAANPKLTVGELDKMALQFRGEAKEMIKGSDSDLQVDNEKYDKWKADPESAILADSYAKTGNLTNLVRGRGKQAEEKADFIQKLAAERHPDMDLAANMIKNKGDTAENMAEQRTVGTRVGSAKYASEAVNGAADMALASSNKFDRTKYPSFNAAYQAWEKGTGDPSVIDFIVKNNTLINEYAAAQNPRGIPRISDKDHARELLETSYNKGQYEAGVKAILQETANIKRSADKVKAEEAGKGLAGKSPDDKHVKMLKDDPSEENREYFDEAFGEGAADKILGK